MSPVYSPDQNISSDPLARLPAFTPLQEPPWRILGSPGAAQPRRPLSTLLSSAGDAAPLGSQGPPRPRVLLPRSSFGQDPDVRVGCHCPALCTLNPPRSKASLARSPLRSSPVCQHLHLDVTFHPTWPNPNFSSSSPTPHQSSSLSRNAYYSPSCWRQNPPTRHVIDSSLVSASDTRPSCPVCNFQRHFFLGNTATPQPLFTLCIL